jgi:signal transduction histidine kinase
VQVGGRAIDDTRVISFPGAAFRRLCRQDEDLLARVVGLVADVVSGNEAMLRQRDRLASVGTLAAGLSHEINNPAAAALRQVAALRATLGGLLDGHAGAAAALPGRVQDALEAADSEEALGAWLADRGVADAWGTAAALAEAGADVAWAEQVGAERLPAVATAVAAGGLLDELDDALRRIVALTATMRDYAHLDQSPEADVDVTHGVETSIEMLSGLLEATSTVVSRAWARTTPIVAYPAELNEVWTALLRNAVEAAPGGTVEVRGEPLDGGGVRVSIADQGPGVPDDLRERIWDAFFSTKDGASGLGLDLARRTVVGRHRGKITLQPRSDGPAGSVVVVDLRRPDDRRRRPARPAPARRPAAREPGPARRLVTVRELEEGELLSATRRRCGTSVMLAEGRPYTQARSRARSSRLGHEHVGLPRTSEPSSSCRAAVQTGTARAVSRARVLLLDEDAFFDLLRCEPAVGAEIFSRFAPVFSKLEGLRASATSSWRSGARRGARARAQQPAAAAARGAAELREALGELEDAPRALAAAGVAPETLARAREALDGAVAGGAGDALGAADLEDELGAWLDERDVPGAWDAASALVEAGLALDAVAPVADGLEGPAAAAVLGGSRRPPARGARRRGCARTRRGSPRSSGR